DELFEFLRGQLRDSAGLEAERLLYVACTRAKWRLLLTARVGRAEESEKPNEPAEGTAEHTAEDAAEDAAERESWSPRAGSLLAVLWPVAGREFALPDPLAAAPDETATAPRGGPLWRVPAG